VFEIGMNHADLTTIDLDARRDKGFAEGLAAGR
jgi:hypothetical protein